jgi:hypothetical protein
MFDWLREYSALWWWLGIGSAVLFVATLVLLPILIARLPADYFTRKRKPESSWSSRHPAARIAVAVLKNLVGALLVLAGIVMLALPGQGVLAILVGLTLVDFPGKTRLMRSLVRRPAVARALNWIRRKAGRPPLEVPQ